MSTSLEKAREFLEAAVYASREVGPPLEDEGQCGLGGGPAPLSNFTARQRELLGLLAPRLEPLLGKPSAERVSQFPALIKRLPDQTENPPFTPPLGTRRTEPISNEELHEHLKMYGGLPTPPPSTPPPDGSSAPPHSPSPDEVSLLTVRDLANRWVRLQDGMDRKRNHFLKAFRAEHGFARSAYSPEVLALYQSTLDAINGENDERLDEMAHLVLAALGVEVPQT